MNLVYSNKDKYTWLFNDEDKYYLNFIDNYFCEYALQLNSPEIETVISDYSTVIKLTDAFRNGTESMKDRLIDIKPFKLWWERNSK